MRTLTLLAAAAATTLTLAAPASAQFAFAGDGLFGHDYAASQATSPGSTNSAPQHVVSFGYPSNTVTKLPGALRSVHHIRARQARSPSKNISHARGVAPVQAPVQNVY